MKTNMKWYFYAILDAVGVLAYVAIVAWVMTNGNAWFGQVKGVGGPIAILMLLVLSAAVVGMLVFGRPILVFLDGRKREAVMMAITTVASIAVLTLAVFSTLALLS